jgi:hypothetical protein
MGVPGAFDTHPHLMDQLDHVVGGVDPDVGEHALGGRELPAAAIQRLEAEPGHDGGGEGIVGTGSVEIGLPFPGLVKQPAKLVRRLLGLRWSKQLLKGLGGISRVGGDGSGCGGHRLVSLGGAGRLVKLFT